MHFWNRWCAIQCRWNDCYFFRIDPTTQWQRHACLVTAIASAPGTAVAHTTLHCDVSRSALSPCRCFWPSVYKSSAFATDGTTAASQQTELLSPLHLRNLHVFNFQHVPWLIWFCATLIAFVYDDDDDDWQVFFAEQSPTSCDIK